MKIKIDNIFKKIGGIFKTKKEEHKEATVIKFSRTMDTKEDENVVENVDKKIRNGACINKEKKKIKIDKKAQKIFIGMVMLLLLTTSLNIRYKDYLKFESYEPKEIDSVATVSTNIDDSGGSTQEIAKATKAEEKVITKPVKVEEKLVFIPALDGQIQKMYSVDKVIYSKTLQQWKTHDGLDIAANLNTEVKAIEKGVVDSIYNDSFYGKTIKIEHKNGYRSVYSNLNDNVYVNVGESVVKGQKIGKIGNTSVGEYLDEPHLHFMLFLNDKSVDPTYIFE